jgi:hypothetical protein
LLSFRMLWLLSLLLRFPRNSNSFRLRFKDKTLIRILWRLLSTRSSRREVRTQDSQLQLLVSLTVRSQLQDNNRSLTVRSLLLDNSRSLTARSQLQDNSRSLTVRSQLQDNNRSLTVRSLLLDSSQLLGKVNRRLTVRSRFSGQPGQFAPGPGAGGPPGRPPPPPIAAGPPMARALQAYAGQSATEVSFAAGEIVTVLNKVFFFFEKSLVGPLLFLT